MQLQQWIENAKSDKLQVGWNEITITAVGPSGATHVGKFKVSTDAVRLQSERNRLTCTAEAQQQTADLYDGLLLTSKLYEERWVQSSVKTRPSPSDVTKDKEGSAHSDRIDKQLTSGSIDAVAGAWIVADPSKTWILDERCTTKAAVNHGWIVPKEEVTSSSGKTYWRGIPVSKCISIDAYMIQNRGGKHDAFYHLDYSQMNMMVYGWCEIDGEQMRTSDVYTSKELACLVTYSGNPLLWARQPGVLQLSPMAQEVDEVSTIPVPAEVAVVPEEPEGAEPWLNPDKPHGWRAVMWSLNELKDKVVEVPNGTNNGPRIKLYLATTEREGKPGFGKWLAGAGGNWCAAAYSYAQLQTLLPGDPEQDFLSRAGGIELENDAKKKGNWRPAKMVRETGFLVETGDCVVLGRGTAGWQRHICRYVRRIDEHTYETIGGNEGNGWHLTVRRFDAKNLLGFIEQPDAWDSRDDEAIQNTLQLDYADLATDPEDRITEMLAALYDADPADDGENVA